MFDKPREKGSSDIWIKLKDGDSVTGVCRGDIVQGYEKWDGSKNRSEPCEPGTDGARFRFKVNFVLKDPAQGESPVKILNLGGSVYDALHDFAAGGYGMSQTWFKITRHGSGLDTSYSVLPLPESKLTEAEEAAVSDLPLHSLEPQADDDIPF